MRVNRTELPSPLAAPRPPKLSESGRDRSDFTTQLYRGPEKLSPRVCFLLIAGTSLVLWIALIEALREVW